MNKKNFVVLLLIGVIIVGGGSFYGGILYNKSKNTKSFDLTSFQGMKTNRTNLIGGGLISGEIISNDGNSVTVKTPTNGGSKIIFYSDTTQISKAASGTFADLTTGTSVTITGTTNSNGSITAQSIQIRPTGQNRGTN